MSHVVMKLSMAVCMPASVSIYYFFVCPKFSCCLKNSNAVVDVEKF